MSEKKQRRDADRELIREKMREIDRSDESHARDKVAAGKLLRQVNHDEADEPSNSSEDQFENGEHAWLRGVFSQAPSDADDD